MLEKSLLSSSSSLQMTFTEVKCMIRMMYVAITKRGSGGPRPPDVDTLTQISAPPYLKVLPTPLAVSILLLTAK